MHNVGNILFDLDGTLTDPKEGFLKSVSFALDKIGFKSPPFDELETHIGPPLLQIFQNIGVNDIKKAEEAVQFYRQRHNAEGKGILENKLYAGIPYALAELQNKNKKLFVCTSKPWIISEKIIKHFNLQSYFKHIYGPELDGTRNDKGELIAYILERENISPENAVMVGDRKHDIIGATKNGVRGIGVCWGYGSAEELKKAGALAIVERPEELENLFK
jgi:phosphoglycolate phosphatase